MANTSILGLTKPSYTDDADISDLNGNFDLIDAEAGRLRANFAPTYSTSSAYAVGDYVVYTGNLYRCTTAIGSGGESWTAGHWTQVAIGTEVKGLSDQIGNYLKKEHINCTPSANLTAGEYGYWSIPVTYAKGKTIITTSIGLAHLVNSGGLQITANYVNGDYLYVSYYSPRAITAAQADFTVDIIYSDQTITTSSHNETIS